MAYFVFNNINSNTKNIFVSDLSQPRSADMRVEVTEIDGRDGAIIDRLGYKQYDKWADIALYPEDCTTANMDAIYGWLTGAGDLVFSNEPTKKYKAEITSGIEFKRLNDDFDDILTARVTFIVQPYKYAVDEAAVTTTGAQNTAKNLPVANDGNKDSLPLIVVAGSGDVAISVNSNEVCTLAIGASILLIYLDSEAQDAYTLSNGVKTYKNNIMTGKFPVLRPGANTITWTGTTNSIAVYNRSRWC